MDEEGICPDDLETKVMEYKDTWDKTTTDKLYRGVVYTVPVFHNPSGICYSPGSYMYCR
jgi:DNA-binding transcriptional MocR family regulator